MLGDPSDIISIVWVITPRTRVAYISTDTIQLSGRRLVSQSLPFLLLPLHLRRPVGFCLRYGYEPLLGTPHEIARGKLGNYCLEPSLGVAHVTRRLQVNPSLIVIIRGLQE